MRWFRLAILYTALALSANGAAADTADLAGLRQGSMMKLNFHDSPQEIPADMALTDLDGAEARLSDYAGNIVLVNFWATWCAPCRKEMPMLDALQADLGGDGFEVVTVAVGRNPVPGIRRFFSEVGVSHVRALRDPKQALARQMAVLGLPITVILDREGREIARLRGDADWNGESARAIIRALTDESGA